MQKNCPWYYRTNSWEEIQDIPWDKEKNEPLTPGQHAPARIFVDFVKLGPEDACGVHQKCEFDIYLSRSKLLLHISPKIAQWIAATIGEKATEIDEMTFTLNKQAGELAMAKQQIVETVKSVSLLEDKNIQYNKQLEALQARVVEKDKELASIKETLSMQNEEIETLQNRVRNKVKEVNHLSATTERQSKTIAELKEVNHGHVATIKKRDKLISNLNVHLKILLAPIGSDGTHPLQKLTPQLSKKRRPVYPTDDTKSVKRKKTTEASTGECIHTKTNRDLIPKTASSSKARHPKRKKHTRHGKPAPERGQK